MPSPSKLHLFSGLFVSAGIILGGAYLASALSPDESQAKRLELKDAVMPAIIPNIVEPRTTPIQTVQVEPSADTKTEPTQSLTVTISDVRNHHGNIIVLVFNDAKTYAAYDYTQAVGYMEVPAQKGSITVNFPELTGGPYIVTLFHDENADQDFNMREGYPVEGYGTSGAKGPYDEVSFQQGAIMAGDITVRMHYLEP